MPSSHQSQQEGDATLRTESPRRDEKQPAEDVEKPSSIFDNHETYFPVFFLVEAPEEVRHCLRNQVLIARLNVDVVL